MARKTDPHDTLCRQAALKCADEPALADLIGFNPDALPHDGALVAEVLARLAPEGRARDQLRTLACAAFAPGTQAFDLVCEDVLVTATRDDDPLGPVASLLFANGLQTLLGYRLTSTLWRQGQHATALALKTLFLRALGADIMPQASIGRRVWIDHGLGIVIGQTAVIEDDANLWHGVTMGTNMVARGPGRHPRIRRGAVIGAGAKLIGPIEIGAGAVVAAGANVVTDVPPGAIAVGAKARILEDRARPAAEMGIPLGPLD